MKMTLNYLCIFFHPFFLSLHSHIQSIYIYIYVEIILEDGYSCIFWGECMWIGRLLLGHCHSFNKGGKIPLEPVALVWVL